LLKTTIAALVAACFAMPAVAESGRASHYGHGDGFHGRRTASGERFNKMGMTAAMRGHMGRRAAVTNTANGRTVHVRINDYGPAKWTGKIIDLSYGAAIAIGCGGTCRVSIQ
jgi:rare lipoprotein A